MESDDLDPAPEEPGPDPLLEEVDTLVRLEDMGVRLVHRETGIVVDSITEPTQIANRENALRLLRERLADAAPGEP